MNIPEFISIEEQRQWYAAHQADLCPLTRIQDTKPKQKTVLISVSKRNLERFMEAWRTLDEDTKEVIAGGLAVLNHQPVGRIEIIKAVIGSLSPYRKNLLRELAQITENE